MERLWNLGEENPFAERPPGRLGRFAFGASGAAIGAIGLLQSLAPVHSAAFGAVAMSLAGVAFVPAIDRKLAELMLARRTARRAPLVRLAALRGIEERSVVRVQGTVRARQPAAAGYRSEEPCVWRRVEVRVRVIADGISEARKFSFYHDLMENFDVEEAGGQLVGVDLTSARLLARPGRKLRAAPGTRLAGVAPFPGWMLAIQPRVCLVETRSLLLCEGDPVEVIGVLTHVPDPSGAALCRETATRPVLAAGARAVVVLPGRDARAAAP